MDFKLYESRSFSLIVWFSVKFLGRFKRHRRELSAAMINVP